MLQLFSATSASIALGIALSVGAAEIKSKQGVIRIGTCGILDQSGGQGAVAREALRGFIKAETGFENELTTEENYEVLASKLVEGDLEIGILQGFEFAWVRAKHSQLRIMALAVDGSAYRYAHVLVAKNSPLKKLAEVRGHSFAMPRGAQGHLRFYVEREVTKSEKIGDFFSAVLTSDSVEDAVDDVIEGKVAVAAVDGIGLEAYKRRKPGRYALVKEIAGSRALPPPVVIFLDQGIEPAVVRRFTDGLIQAKDAKRGQFVLILFKLKGFEKAPADFDAVLEKTAKAYPPLVLCHMPADGWYPLGAGPRKTSFPRRVLWTSAIASP